MIASPIAVELSVTDWHAGVASEYGRLKPPSFALADIGSCLDGRPNCLIDFCQNRGVCPSVLIFAPKVSMVHREYQSYRQQWQYAFSSDIKVISSESVDLPKKNARPPTTRRKTNQGGKIEVKPSDPDTSSSEDDESFDGSVGNTGRKSNVESKFMDDSGDEELHGGAVSENEVIRNLRKPVLDTKQVFELVKASIDRRHYFVIASRLDKNVIAHWYGRERRKLIKVYKRAKARVLELTPLVRVKLSS